MAAVRFIALWASLIGALGAAAVTIELRSPWILALAVAAAQWLLLRSRVTWATRWGVAVAVSGVLVGIVVPLATPLLSVVPRPMVLLVYSALNSAPTAVLLVVALWPLYGSRSLVWLLTRPLTPTLVSIVVQPLLRPLTVSEGTRPLAVLALTFCAAAVDAAVLLWVSRGAVLDRISTDAEALPQPSGHGTEGLGVEIPVAVIAVICLFGGVAALSLGQIIGFDGAFVAVLAAPYLVSAACLLAPRVRHVGLALASGGAAAVTLAAAPFAVLGAPYLIEFAARIDGSGLAVLGLVPLHAVLAVTGYGAVRRHVPRGQRAAVLMAGAAGAVVYCVVAAAIVSGREEWVREARANAYEAQRATDSLFDDLRQCLQQHGQQSRRAVWPTRVEGLGAAGLRCIDADRFDAAGGRDRVRWAVPLATTPRAFTMCVTRQTPSGQRSAQILDERLDGYQAEPMAAPLDQVCAAAHGSDALRALRYCLWRFAAEHDGYPSDLSEVDDCAGPSLEQTSDETRFTYAPGPPDSAGRIVTFVVIEGLAEWSPGQRSRRMDEIGTIRVTREPRIPSLYDPLESDPAAMREPPASPPAEPAYADLQGSPAGALAMRRCFADPGVGAACPEAVRFAAETQHATITRQERILQRGCNLGDATSCLTLGRLSVAGQLADMPPALGEQLQAIACSTAPVPDGCDPER